MTASPRPNLEPLKRGKARAIELAREAEAERQALAAEILAGLGRLPSALDRIAVESIAAAAVRARRLRAMGRDDLEQQRLIAQLLRATGLKPDKPAPPRQEDFTSEMMRFAMPQGGRTEARALESVDAASDSEQRTEGYGLQPGDGLA